MLQSWHNIHKIVTVFPRFCYYVEKYDQKQKELNFTQISEQNQKHCFDWYRFWKRTYASFRDHHIIFCRIIFFTNRTRQ